jgi:hypothetical protein
MPVVQDGRAFTADSRLVTEVGRAAVLNGAITVTTDNGAFQVYDAATGVELRRATVSLDVTGPTAISGPMMLGSVVRDSFVWAPIRGVKRVTVVEHGRPSQRPH